MRTIHCPTCGGAFVGDWTRVECRKCGHAVHPVATAAFLKPGEVVRLAAGGVLVAVAA